MKKRTCTPKNEVLTYAAALDTHRYPTVQPRANEQSESRSFAKMSQDVRNVDLFYDHANSEESALKLVTALFPDWESQKDTIEFVRFKDGITNTVRCNNYGNWASFTTISDTSIALEGGK